MKKLKEIIKHEGLRYTFQREEIWNELRSTNEHRTAEEIFLALQNRDLNISRATVYRTIDVLVNYKMIDKLDIGDGKSRFEYNEKFTHHDHLVCNKCGKIIEFHDDDIERLQKLITKQNNFKLLDHSHQIFGICEDCQ